MQDFKGFFKFIFLFFNAEVKISMTESVYAQENEPFA